MLIIASPWIYCSHVFHFPHDCNCLDHKSVDKNQQEPGHHRQSPDLLHLPMSSSILRVLLQLVFQLLQFLLKLLLNSSRLHLLVTRGQGWNRVLVSLISWPGQLLSLNPCRRPKILARMLFLRILSLTVVIVRGHYSLINWRLCSNIGESIQT